MNNLFLFFVLTFFLDFSSCKEHVGRCNSGNIHLFTLVLFLFKSCGEWIQASWWEAALILSFACHCLNVWILPQSWLHTRGHVSACTYESSRNFGDVLSSEISPTINTWMIVLRTYESSHNLGNVHSFEIFPYLMSASFRLSFFVICTLHS